MSTIDLPPFEVDCETGEMPNPHAVMLRTDYNYNRDLASLASGLACEDSSRTRQDMKDECDINVIVERFGLTGELPLSVNMPFNGEFNTVIDYQTALNRIMQADDAFMEFPANVRERFHNNPAEMIAWAEDRNNLEEARALGLAPPAPKAPESAPAGAPTSAPT